MTKFLLCKPTFYGVKYEINPWMDIEKSPSWVKANSQWNKLKTVISKCKAKINYLNPSPILPDMVFTANAGILKGDTFLPSNFRYKERQGEKDHFKRWFKNEGYQVYEVHPEISCEGAGDALFEGKTLFAGYGIRTDKEAYNTICKVLEIDDLILCHLVDDYFYHLDTCFCPLGNGHAIVYPKAFSSTSLERMSKEIKLHEVPEKDAKKFACNAVVIDNQVIIPSGCNKTRKILEDLGMIVFDVDMDQFILAGGACKCLTIKI
jgi:N-dimethylarginine dimethylaminohydrolase